MFRMLREKAIWSSFSGYDTILIYEEQFFFFSISVVPSAFLEYYAKQVVSGYKEKEGESASTLNTTISIRVKGTVCQDLFVLSFGRLPSQFTEV
jgi:hypothetical protein